MSARWFHRLGDVPGLAYEAPPVIDRTSLPGHDVSPKIRELGSEQPDGELRRYLDWGSVIDDQFETDDPDEEVYRGYEAPVREYLRGPLSDADCSTGVLLSRLWEGLELPGQVGDYQHALEQVSDILRRRVLQEPRVLDSLEHLYGLGVRLAIASPDDGTLFGRDRDGNPMPPNAFQYLIHLYCAEGFLLEAASVAREMERTFGRSRDADDINAWLEHIRAENVR